MCYRESEDVFVPFVFVCVSFVCSVCETQTKKKSALPTLIFVLCYANQTIFFFRPNAIPLWLLHAGVPLSVLCMQLLHVAPVTEAPNYPQTKEYPHRYFNLEYNHSGTVLYTFYMKPRQPPDDLFVYTYRSTKLSLISMQLYFKGLYSDCHGRLQFRFKHLTFSADGR